MLSRKEDAASSHAPQTACRLWLCQRWMRALPQQCSCCRGMPPMLAANGAAHPACHPALPSPAQSANLGLAPAIGRADTTANLVSLQRHSSGIVVVQTFARRQQTCCNSCLGVNRRGCAAVAGGGDGGLVGAPLGWLVTSSASVASARSGAKALELPREADLCGEPKGAAALLLEAAATGDTATVGAGAGVLVGSRCDPGDGDGPRAAPTCRNLATQHIAITLTTSVHYNDAQTAYQESATTQLATRLAAAATETASLFVGPGGTGWQPGCTVGLRWVAPRTARCSASETGKVSGGRILACQFMPAYYICWKPARTSYRLP